MLRGGCELSHALVLPGSEEALLSAVRPNLWDILPGVRQQKAPRLSRAMVVKSGRLKISRQTSFIV